MITAPHPDGAAARPENGQTGFQALKVRRHLRFSVFAGGFLVTIMIKNDSKTYNDILYRQKYSQDCCFHFFQNFV